MSHFEQLLSVLCLQIVMDGKISDAADKVRHELIDENKKAWDFWQEHKKYSFLDMMIGNKQYGHVFLEILDVQLNGMLPDGTTVDVSTSLWLDDLIKKLQHTPPEENI